MKRVNLATLSVKERDDALREIEVLAALNHPTIIKYYESFVDKGHICIVMEYANAGDLYSLIKKRQARKELLPQNDVLTIFTLLVLSLKYCHAKKVRKRRKEMEKETRRAILTRECCWLLLLLL